jgi:hypothetical protein
MANGRRPHGLVGANPVVRAVGGGPLTDIEPFAESWDGTSWTLAAGTAPSAGSPGVSAISCISPSFCVAVGSTVAASAGRFDGGGFGSSNPGSALVEVWNGATWTVQATPAGAVAHTALSGVSCTSDSSCVAVGARGVGRYRQYALAETSNGTRWRQSAVPSTGKYGTWLTGISCKAAEWCTAAGGVANAYFDGPPGSGIPTVQPVAERWNGKRWVTSTLQGVGPAGIEVGKRVERISQGDLTAVSCSSRSLCLASGVFQLSQSDQSPEAFARRWNGRSWSRIPLPLTPAASSGRWRGGLASVACVAPVACTAVGEQPSGTYDAPLAQSDL